MEDLFQLFWSLVGRYFMNFLLFIVTFYGFQILGGVKGFYGLVLTIFVWLVNIITGFLTYGLVYLPFMIVFVISIPFVIKLYYYVFPQKELTEWEKEEKWRKERNLPPKSIYKS